MLVESLLLLCDRCFGVEGGKRLRCVGCMYACRFVLCALLLTRAAAAPVASPSPRPRPPRSPCRAPVFDAMHTRMGACTYGRQLVNRHTYTHTFSPLSLYLFKHKHKHARAHTQHTISPSFSLHTSTQSTRTLNLVDRRKSAAAADTFTGPLISSSFSSAGLPLLPALLATAAADDRLEGDWVCIQRRRKYVGRCVLYAEWLGVGFFRLCIHLPTYPPYQNAHGCSNRTTDREQARVRFEGDIDQVEHEVRDGGAQGQRAVLLMSVGMRMGVGTVNATLWCGV